ncbi:hypothetical protein CC80DRAFT_503006 [Byssothecium circinans]|uniref:Uncharacterized protein n=1 Tax=Byssothecium circinans TaxID=147558 RepID=A0A6A5U1R2_9PLEO|nr:hypothetical protein CC80DRAFT_503006 [Byssothecium circinans]
MSNFASRGSGRQGGDTSNASPSSRPGRQQANEAKRPSGFTSRKDVPRDSVMNATYTPSAETPFNDDSGDRPLYETPARKRKRRHEAKAPPGRRQNSSPIPCFGQDSLEIVQDGAFSTLRSSHRGADRGVGSSQLTSDTVATGSQRQSADLEWPLASVEAVDSLRGENLGDVSEGRSRSKYRRLDFAQNGFNIGASNRNARGADHGHDESGGNDGHARGEDRGRVNIADVHARGAGRGRGGGSSDEGDDDEHARGEDRGRVRGDGHAHGAGRVHDGSSGDESDNSVSSSVVPMSSLEFDYKDVWTDPSHPYPGSRGYLSAVAFQHSRSMAYGLTMNMSENHWRQFCGNLLSSIPKPIPAEVVAGNLHKAYIQGTDYSPDDRNVLSDYFDADTPWMKEALGTQEGDKCKDAPCIYVISLTTDQGNALSGTQMERLLRYCELYIKLQPNGTKEDLNKVVAIDNAIQTAKVSVTERKHIRAGQHRFLGIRRTTRQWRRVEDRVAKVREFIAAVRSTLKQIPEDEKDRPMKRPLQCFGYAWNFMTRDRQHQDGDASNFLLQLVRNISQLLWKGNFALRIYPICFVVDYDEARCGEMVLTLIGGGMVHSGEGLNTHPPGQNNASADLSQWKVVDEQKFRQDRIRFRDEETPFKARLEEDRIEARRSIRMAEQIAEEVEQMEKKLEEEPLKGDDKAECERLWREGCARQREISHYSKMINEAVWPDVGKGKEEVKAKMIEEEMDTRERSV